MSPDPAAPELDALVIGAGLAGLHQLHRLRELGLRVRAYEAAGDVGGTWWWHYYPGARLDTEGHVYQYLFSRELYEQWGWSERYPAGYEVQRWLRFVADRLDLRRDIALDTRVRSAHWDDGCGHWTVRTDRGETVTTRFVVGCAGLLPAPREELASRDAFAGLIMDTAHWPERGPDLRGRRVGVMGVGTVGVQLVERIADDVDHLTLFVDRPPYVLPRSNPHYGWREREAYRSRFDALAAAVTSTATGDDREPEHVWADHGPTEREAILAEAWRDGSQALVRATFHGVGTDREVTDGVSAFVRRAMRARLGDERLAEVVVPRDHGIGTRPVPLESGYLRTLEREHVEVVDLRVTPIARLCAGGVELADGTVHELDVLARTDEFDAGPPALTRIDVRGRDGRSLAHERVWTSVLGLAPHGYPNLLTTAMPFVPHGTRSTVLQVQVEWITELIRGLRSGGWSRIEATREGQRSWFSRHERLLRARAATGPIVEAGGVDDVGDYRRCCAAEAAAGYPSFVRS